MPGAMRWGRPTTRAPAEGAPASTGRHRGRRRSARRCRTRRACGTGRRADEQARRRSLAEHASRTCVVLLLVDLARLDERVDLAEPVDAEADVLQQARVVPVDELRPDDAGVGAVQLLDEQPDGIRLEGDVVVHQAEEPVVAFDEVEHLVGRRAIAGVAVEGADESLRQPATDLFVDGASDRRTPGRGSAAEDSPRGRDLSRTSADTRPRARGPRRPPRRAGRSPGFHGRARLAARSDDLHPRSPTRVLAKLALWVTM